MTLVERLRNALGEGALRDPILIEGDMRDQDMTASETWVPAAVLVPIIDKPDPAVLLTLRNASMRKHAG